MENKVASGSDEGVWEATEFEIRNPNLEILNKHESTKHETQATCSNADGEAEKLTFQSARLRNPSPGTRCNFSMSAFQLFSTLQKR
jgi:hypothetical protein